VDALKLEPKHFAFIALMAVVAVAPMLIRGIPGGNDAVQHYEFAQQVVDSIRTGDAFPAFAGNSNHGLGDVGLRVYPPLSYYILAGFYLTVGDWYFASIFAFFLIFLIGAGGIFLWAREGLSVNAGIAAAAVYTFAPFHLNEIYNNFLYAEFAAGAILPFCFLFVARTLRTGKFADAILLAISFALLVITHLPLTIIGSLSLAVYSVVSLRKANNRNIVKLFSGAAFGLILSSFYWVRMVTEMSWVKHSQPEYYARIWSYQENFLISLRTFTDFMNDGLSLWFGDLMLVATLVLCIPSLIFLIRTTGKTREYLPIGSLFAFGVFMATPLSLPIWQLANVLQRTQFPWRWLTIITVSGSVIAGAAIVEAHKRLKDSDNKTAMLFAAVALLPFIFLSAFVVRAPNFTQRAEFNDRSVAFSDGETFEGWWPVWARRQAFSNRDKVVAGNRQVEISKWAPTHRIFNVAQGPDGSVEVSTFYYPHWKATVDGTLVEVNHNSDGAIALEIPSTAVSVELKFIEPPIVTISKLGSALAWLLAIVFLLFSFVRRQQSYGDYS
jgi:hypothetical protein